MTMADTVAVMNAGHLEQVGTPTDLYDHPATTFVANFLGKSNLFEAEITGREADTLSIRFGGAVCGLPSSRAVQHEGRIVVGIRPEKIVLSRAGGEAPANCTGWTCVSGARVTSANAYSERYWAMIREGERRLSASTLTIMASGAPFRTLQDLLANRDELQKVFGELIPTLVLEPEPDEESE